MAGLPVAEACQPQDPKNRLTDLYHRQKLFFLLLPLPRHAERCRALKETHSWPSLLLFLSVSFPHPSLISGASCSPWFSRLEHQSISQTHARFPSLTHSLTLLHTLSHSLAHQKDLERLFAWYPPAHRAVKAWYGPLSAVSLLSFSPSLPACPSSLRVDIPPRLRGERSELVKTTVKPPSPTPGPRCPGREPPVPPGFPSEQLPVQMVPECSVGRG